jgi:maltooligosyltrehalose trehalohydrolase
MTRTFAVWAPRAAESVRLELEHSGQEMDRAADGWWTTRADAVPGDTYQFRIDGGEPLTDPRALRLPEGPHGPAMVHDPTGFPWTDDAWRGVPLPGSVIYELHVGTFTERGDLDGAIERLDHLVALGVDLVELLPVASFPGHHNWGYDGVGLFAVQESYGGPDAMMRFVDACHRRGLGVCLDVVYNHAGWGSRLWEFGPYFAEEGTAWGSALNLDGPDSDEVRRFVLDNTAMWLRDFHVDALRLDAVHALRDNRATTLLEALSAQTEALAARVGRPLWLIAESDRNDPRTVTPRAAGGTGLDAQWADDVHHALHVLLTGEDTGYYADFAAPGTLEKVLTRVFLHDGTWSSFRRRHHGRPVDRRTTAGWRFVVSLQTHDQVGNRAQGDRLSAGLDPGLLACGAALLLTSAYTPMLFMGEEWGATTPWQFFTDHTDAEIATQITAGRYQEFADHGWGSAEVPAPQDLQTFIRSHLDWEEAAEQQHLRLLHWYQALTALRRERADLRDPRLGLVAVTHDRERGLVVVERGEHRVLVNLSDEVAEIPFSGVTRPELLLAWDRATAICGGDRVVRLPARAAGIVGPSSRHCSPDRPPLL